MIRPAQPRACSTAECEQPATAQWQRRATDEEWAAHVQLCRQRAAEFGYDADALVPRDGLALQTVYGCDEHQQPSAE